MYEEQYSFYSLIGASCEASLLVGTGAPACSLLAVGPWEWAALPGRLPPCILNPACRASTAALGPRFWGQIDGQDQSLTDFLQCLKSRPLGAPGICRLRDAKAAHMQWKPIYRTAISRMQANSFKAWKNQIEFAAIWQGWNWILVLPGLLSPAGLGDCLSSEFGASQWRTPLLPACLRTHHHLSQQLISTEGQRSWEIWIEKKQSDEETWKFFIIQFFQM